MNRDPQLLMSIQIALMGIVLVVGFFFIWRTLSRLENKIEQLSCQNVNNACLLNQRPSIYAGQSSPPIMKEQCDENRDEDCDEDCDEEDYDENDEFSIMKNCFGDIPLESLMDDGGATFMIFNTTKINEEDQQEGVILEEIETKEIKETKDIKTTKEKDAEKDKDTVSVADTDANELSKSKLKKMGVDTLKELCVARGLPTDGLKNVLIDRILASVPNS